MSHDPIRLEDTGFDVKLFLLVLLGIMVVAVVFTVFGAQYPLKGLR